LKNADVSELLMTQLRIFVCALSLLKSIASYILSMKGLIGGQYPEQMSPLNKTLT